jgi:hypothetical protein
MSETTNSPEGAAKLTGGRTVVSWSSNVENAGPKSVWLQPPTIRPASDTAAMR